MQTQDNLVLSLRNSIKKTLYSQKLGTEERAQKKISEQQNIENFLKC